MSNGSHSPSEKSFIVDFRNCKYQGQLSVNSRLPQGIGTLLTLDYLMAVGHWVQGSLEGPFFVAYPQGNLLYGHLQHRKPHGYLSYQVSKKNFLYLFGQQNRSTLFFMDSLLTKTLVGIRLEPHQIQQIENNSDLKAEINLDFIDPRFHKQRNVVLDTTYKHEDEKWDIISRVTGSPLPAEFKHYHHFLKYHFNSPSIPKDLKLEISQTKDFIEIKYRKAGIVCRIDDKARNEKKMTLMGFYDHHQNRCDIYRKVKGEEIQQNCDGHSVIYAKERPQECKTNFAKYLKQSCSFLNSFIQTGYLSKMRYVFNQIFLLMQMDMSAKNAQFQLQSGQGQVEEVSGQVRQEDPLQTFRQIDLKTVKDDIYNRARKISSNKYKNPSSYSRNQSNNSYLASEFQENSFSENFSPSPQPIPIRKSPEPSTDKYSPEQSQVRYHRDSPLNTPNRNREYLKYTQAHQVSFSPEDHNRSRKKFQYLLQDRQDRVSRENYHHQLQSQQEQYPNARYNPNGQKDNNINNSQGPSRYDNTGASRYDDSALSRQNRVNREYIGYAKYVKKPTQSIGDLTFNYERIQQQLSQQKSRSRGVSPKGTPRSRANQASRWVRRDWR